MRLVPSDLAHRAVCHTAIIRLVALSLNSQRPLLAPERVDFVAELKDLQGVGGGLGRGGGEGGGGCIPLHLG